MAVDRLDFAMRSWLRANHNLFVLENLYADAMQKYLFTMSIRDFVEMGVHPLVPAVSR